MNIQLTRGSFNLFRRHLRITYVLFLMGYLLLPIRKKRAYWKKGFKSNHYRFMHNEIERAHEVYG